MKVLAFAVSILFHPLLLPLYVLFITFNSGTIFSYVPAYTQNMSYLLTLLGVTLTIAKVVGVDRELSLDAQAGSGVPRVGNDRGGVYRFLFFPELALFQYRATVLPDHGDYAFRFYDRDDPLEDQHAHDGDRGLVRVRVYLGDEIFGRSD